MGIKFTKPTTTYHLPYGITIDSDVATDADIGVGKLNHTALIGDNNSGTITWICADGSASDGASGGITAGAGNGDTKAGGSITLTGGVGITSGAGGNIQLTPGDSPSGTAGSVLVGANQEGHDVKMFAATDANYLLWDASLDDLLLVGTATQFDVAGTTEASASSDGSIHTAGGVGIAKALYVGNYMVLEAGAWVTAKTGVWNEGAGELHLNAITGKTIVLEIADGAEYTFSADALAMNSNNISGLGTLGTTGAITIAPGVAGTFLDFVLEDEWVSGTLINADFASATTLTNDTIVMLLDFDTQVSMTAEKDLTLIQLKTPDFTGGTNVTTNIIGYDLPVAGALITNSGTCVINWTGLNIQMPNITETLGTMTSYGINIASGTVASGTQIGLNLGANTAGVDAKFFGDTTGAYMLWDASDDALEFTNSKLEMLHTDDKTAAINGIYSYIDTGGTTGWSAGNVVAGRFQVTVDGSADTSSMTAVWAGITWGSTGSCNGMMVAINAEASNTAPNGRPFAILALQSLPGSGASNADMPYIYTFETGLGIGSNILLTMNDATSTAGTLYYNETLQVNINTNTRYIPLSTEQTYFASIYPIAITRATPTTADNAIAGVANITDGWASGEINAAYGKVTITPAGGNTYSAAGGHFEVSISGQSGLGLGLVTALMAKIDADGVDTPNCGAIIEMYPHGTSDWSNVPFLAFADYKDGSGVQTNILFEVGHEPMTAEVSTGGGHLYHNETLQIKVNGSARYLPLSTEQTYFATAYSVRTSGTGRIESGTKAAPLTLDSFSGDDDIYAAYVSGNIVAGMTSGECARNLWSRAKVSGDQDQNVSIYGSCLQLRVNTKDNTVGLTGDGLYSGAWLYFEASDTDEVFTLNSADVTAMAALATVEVAAGHALTAGSVYGININSAVDGGISVGGLTSFSALYINGGSGKEDWTIGVDINDCVTGINIDSGVTTGITSAAPILITDDIQLRFGTGADVTMEWTGEEVLVSDTRTLPDTADYFRAFHAAPSIGMGTGDYYGGISCYLNLVTGGSNGATWAGAIVGTLDQGTTKNVDGYMAAGIFEIKNSALVCSTASALDLVWKNSAASGFGGVTHSFIRCDDTSPADRRVQCLFEMHGMNATTAAASDEIVCQVGAAGTPSHVIKISCNGVPYWIEMSSTPPA